MHRAAASAIASGNTTLNSRLSISAAVRSMIAIDAHVALMAIASAARCSGCLMPLESPAVRRLSACTPFHIVVTRSISAEKATAHTINGPASAPHPDSSMPTTYRVVIQASFLGRDRVNVTRRLHDPHVLDFVLPLPVTRQPHGQTTTFRPFGRPDFMRGW
jgi:hypothetical protein